MTKPGNEHWTGVKRVLRYINGTLNYSLKFQSTKTGVVNLNGFADADWAGDVDTRKSTSGYVFQIGSSTVSWSSKRQTMVALSTTEAEYVALSYATQETIWLRKLLESIGLKQHIATTINEDNQSTISLVKNPKQQTRTKHIDIKYHYVRETVERNCVNVKYCCTALLDKVCVNVQTEPQLIPLENERFDLRTANTSSEARLDIKASDFWNRGQTSLFDIRITDVNAASNKNRPSKTIFREHETRKKREYLQRVLEVEHATFTPLVLGTNGGIGDECGHFVSELANKLSLKQDEPYASIMSWIRKNSLLRSYDQQ